MRVRSEDDFKYVMQDVEKLYFGARYSYNELMVNQDVPFKFKTIIEKYLTDNVDKESTLESIFYYLSEDDFAYRVFRQLRVRVRVSQYKKAYTPDSKEDKQYSEKVYSVSELSGLSPDEKKQKGIIIREIIISKLGLFAFSI